MDTEGNFECTLENNCTHVGHRPVLVTPSAMTSVLFGQAKLTNVPGAIEHLSTYHDFTYYSLCDSLTSPLLDGPSPSRSADVAFGPTSPSDAGNGPVFLTFGRRCISTGIAAGSSYLKKKILQS